jgi:hypothetical protein
MQESVRQGKKNLWQSLRKTLIVVVEYQRLTHQWDQGRENPQPISGLRVSLKDPTLVVAVAILAHLLKLLSPITPRPTPSAEATSETLVVVTGVTDHHPTGVITIHLTPTFIASFVQFYSPPLFM